MLIGDSGEADPEIYAQVFRAHPARIDSMVIRDVTGEGRTSERYRAIFDGIDPMRWHLVMPKEHFGTRDERHARRRV